VRLTENMSSLLSDRRAGVWYRWSAGVGELGGPVGLYEPVTLIGAGYRGKGIANPLVAILSFL